ncbi:MAG: hypothetical protein COB59_01085 [Rhodospirillaceae bacterium]|nr:MAG: hypothetical protein COB59_01085 [Rhodospirillaceae bacterium]
MPFQTHPTYLDFETANQPFAARLGVCMDTIVKDKETHARFLNTLSMMEHMGSRRIMITQSNAGLGQETLKHMSEEVRHAFFFKRKADKMAGRSLEYAEEDMIASPFARMYFKRLESYIAQDVKDEAEPLRIAYLYMSMIIEFRAVWSFELYQTCLDAAGIKLSLKSLLAEEQGHLTEMEENLANLDADTAERVNRFLAKERVLFARLLGRLETAASQS